MADCVFADDPLLPACRGRRQWHHVIPRSRLKREFPYGATYDGLRNVWRPLQRGEQENVLPAWKEVRSLDVIIADPRNQRLVCSDHHELVTGHRIYVAPDDDVWAFAREYGIEGMLGNDLAREGREGGARAE